MSTPTFDISGLINTLIPLVIVILVVMLLVRTLSGAFGAT